MEKKRQAADCFKIRRRIMESIILRQHKLRKIFALANICSASFALQNLIQHKYLRGWIAGWNMFGYVGIYKDEMKVKDYRVFQAYYCGLCKELGKSFQPIVRIGLIYDMVFLAVLLDALPGAKKPYAEAKRCALHPTRKKPMIMENGSLRYSAYMSVLLVWAKLRDDKNDEGRSLKNSLGSCLYHSSFQKAYAVYKNEYDNIGRALEKLYELEKNKCGIADALADQFGGVLRILFTPDFVPNEYKEPVSALAYQMGRWIYLLDAFDDMPEDAKEGRYNPLLLQYGYQSGADMNEFSRTVKDGIAQGLEHTLAQIAIAADKIPFEQNADILFNIFYFGMPHMQGQILERKKTKHEKSIRSFRGERERE